MQPPLQQTLMTLSLLGDTLVSTQTMSLLVYKCLSKQSVLKSAKKKNTFWLMHMLRHVKSYGNSHQICVFVCFEVAIFIYSSLLFSATPRWDSACADQPSIDVFYLLKFPKGVAPPPQSECEWLFPPNPSRVLEGRHLLSLHTFFATASQLSCSIEMVVVNNFLVLFLQSSRGLFSPSCSFSPRQFQGYTASIKNRDGHELNHFS